ncbi:hypothetical protein AB6D11_03005 [Vibrio splendidus]
MRKTSPTALRGAWRELYLRYRYHEDSMNEMNDNVEFKRTVNRQLREHMLYLQKQKSVPTEKEIESYYNELKTSITYSIKSKRIEPTRFCPTSLCTVAQSADYFTMVTEVDEVGNSLDARLFKGSFIIPGEQLSINEMEFLAKTLKGLYEPDEGVVSFIGVVCPTTRVPKPKDEAFVEAVARDEMMAQIHQALNPEMKASLLKRLKRWIQHERLTYCLN